MENLTFQMYYVLTWHLFQRMVDLDIHWFLNEGTQRLAIFTRVFMTPLHALGFPVSPKYEVLEDGYGEDVMEGN